MAKLCGELTVLDVTQGMAGGLATMLLADGGAEVLKIEPPSGDWARGEPGFVMWNRGKKSVVLDLKSSQGQADLRELASTSDVLVSNCKPDSAEKLGLGYEGLAQANPALVHCSITGFGPMSKFAHLKGYDAIVNAKTGRTGAFTKQVQKEGPTYSALMCASYGAAMYAVQGVMAALYAREKTGRGQQLQTSLAQALFAYDWGWLAWQLARRSSPPAGFVRGSPTPQYFVGRTKDGKWLQMANTMSHLMVNFMVGLGLGEVYDDPRFQGLPNISSGPDMEELYTRMHARMQEKTAAEWMEVFTNEVDAACEPFLTTQEAFEHPQIIHNGNFVEVDDPTVGRIRQLGPLVRCSETPMGPQGPAPLLGQHTQEILSSISSRKATVHPNGKPVPRYPLEGVTVIEFATWYAAPFGTAVLAELGARVIKIETLDGDSFRRSGATAIKPQQGKESIALDLKTPEGREIAYRLVKDADMMMHNFRPGVPQRLGIDYETVQTINPKIVYLYAGSYGSTGPSSHRPAMHPIPGAACGGALYQAGRGVPPAPDTPMTYAEIRATSSTLFQANEGNPDCSAALGVATAMMLGLYAREKHGVGQYMETTMIGSCLYTNADDFIQFDGKPDRLVPDRELNGLHALYRFYRAREGWVFLACVTEGEWHSFCSAVERQDLIDDPRFANHGLRLKHDEELLRALEEVMLRRTAADWEPFLAGHDVACAEAASADFAEFANTEPALKESGLWVTVEHPSLGEYQRYGGAITFASYKTRLAPTTYVGEHSREILLEFGFTDKAAQDLKDRKVVTWTTRSADPEA